MITTLQSWKFPSATADSYMYDYYYGVTLFPNRRAFKLHYHNCDEFLIVEQGNIDYYLNEKIFHHDGPCVFFTREGDVHICAGAPDVLFGRHNIRYCREYLEEEALALTRMNSFLCPLNPQESATLIGYARALGQKYEKRGTPTEEKAKNLLLNATLIKIYEIVRRHGIGEINESCLYIADVTHYLHQHYTSKITVEELTQKFFVGRTKLSADFRAYTGTTISGFITKLRLDHAKQLLLAGVSVRECANAVGFEYESNFIHVFRRATGVTPLTFRRNADLDKQKKTAAQKRAVFSLQGGIIT